MPQDDMQDDAEGCSMLQDADHMRDRRLHSTSLWLSLRRVSELESAHMPDCKAQEESGDEGSRRSTCGGAEMFVPIAQVHAMLRGPAGSLVSLDFRRTNPVRGAYPPVQTIHVTVARHAPRSQAVRHR